MSRNIKQKSDLWLPTPMSDHGVLASGWTLWEERYVLDHYNSKPAKSGIWCAPRWESTKLKVRQPLIFSNPNIQILKSQNIHHEMSMVKLGIMVLKMARNHANNARATGAGVNVWKSRIEAPCSNPCWGCAISGLSFLTPKNECVPGRMCVLYVSK